MHCSNDRFEVATLVLQSCKLALWTDNCYEDMSKAIDLDCDGDAKFETGRDVEVEYACVPAP